MTRQAQTTVQESRRQRVMSHLISPMFQVSVRANILVTSVLLSRVSVMFSTSALSMPSTTFLKYWALANSHLSPLTGSLMLQQVSRSAEMSWTNEEFYYKTKYDFWTKYGNSGHCALS